MYQRQLKWRVKLACPVLPIIICHIFILNCKLIVLYYFDRISIFVFCNHRKCSLDVFLFSKLLTMNFDQTQGLVLLPSPSRLFPPFLDLHHSDFHHWIHGQLALWQWWTSGISRVPSRLSAVLLPPLLPPSTVFPC